MAKTKVTITLDAAAVGSIRRLVATGKAASVSGFVQHAVSAALLDVAGWGAILGQALEQSGGPLTAGEREWADGVLGEEPRARKRRTRVA